jgi:valyl-tRNA synthetase
MNRIHDWCISRQLWWGHRLPVWYCDACGEVIVARETPARCPKCSGAALRPETDTLDTWFSSGLWPFVTLGWPEDTDDLRRFYPNDLMIMGFDILFFWGARMIMLGMKFMNDVPFRELYIHALVRDADKQKMSKTKGNVIDPLDVTERYGTDAVRFALAISAAPGTDITFSEEKVESYRAFANKIWNAGRFILMNLEKFPEAMRDALGSALEPIPGVGLEPVAGSETAQLADRWIFSRLAAVTREIDAALATYRFHEAAFTIYHFFWHEFCDWYLEWIKPEITAPPPQDGKLPPAWLNLARLFKSSLHLLHPFMPFITEELWSRLPRAGKEPSLSLAPFQLVSERVADPVSEKQFQTVQELIVTARNAKAEMGLQTQKPSAQVASDDLRVLELFRAHQEVVLRLAGLQALNFTRGRLSAEAGGVRATPEFDVRLFHEAGVDREAERARLLKDREKTENALAQAQKQLENESFMSRAPREVVRGVEQRHAELTAQLRRVVDSLERLG